MGKVPKHLVLYLRFVAGHEYFLWKYKFESNIPESLNSYGSVDFVFQSPFISKQCTVMEVNYKCKVYQNLELHKLSGLKLERCKEIEK